MSVVLLGEMRCNHSGCHAKATVSFDVDHRYVLRDSWPKGWVNGWMGDVHYCPEHASDRGPAVSWSGKRVSP